MSDELVVRHGLANRLLDLGLLVVVGAILIGIFQQFIPDLLDLALNRSDVTEAETGIEYIRQFWDLLPLVVTVFGLIMMVAGAAFEARRPGI